MPTTRVTPFRIDVPQTDVDDMLDRLGRTRWVDDIADVGWDYGVPTSYLRTLVEYWRTTFDWREQEADLNQYPQFVADVDGSAVHFVHVRSSDPDAFPLVLVHGWPFEDFRALIGPLTNPRAYGHESARAFHLVVPTLPGFGFSGATTEVGQASTTRSAKVLVQLMDELGYDRYGTQGGDAGSLIASQMARLAPDRVVGVHLNGPLTIPSWNDDGSGYDEQDRAKVAALQDWNKSETSSYASVHSTRPSTLAHSLNDSPAGLLSWVVDVVKTFIDPALSLPGDSIDKDVLLTDVSILWFTRTIGSSMRLYKEGGQWGAELPSSGVPTGAAIFARDSSIRGIAERQNNIVRWTEHDYGGHFAAMETPDALITDLRAFFAELEPFSRSQRQTRYEAL